MNLKRKLLSYLPKLLSDSSLNKLDTIFDKKKLKNVELSLDYSQKMLLNNFIIGNLKLKKKKLQKYWLML